MELCPHSPQMSQVTPSNGTLFSKWITVKTRQKRSQKGDYGSLHSGEVVWWWRIFFWLISANCEITIASKTGLGKWVVLGFYMVVSELRNGHRWVTTDYRYPLQARWFDIKESLNDFTTNLVKFYEDISLRPKFQVIYNHVRSCMHTIVRDHMEHWLKETKKQNITPVFILSFYFYRSA